MMSTRKAGRFYSNGTPALVFELKTGRATDTSDKAVKEQRERTLRNMPFGTRYEYIQVYGN